MSDALNEASCFQLQYKYVKCSGILNGNILCRVLLVNEVEYNFSLNLFLFLEQFRGVLSVFICFVLINKSQLLDSKQNWIKISNTNNARILKDMLTSVTTTFIIQWTNTSVPPPTLSLVKNFIPYSISPSLPYLHQTWGFPF